MQRRDPQRGLLLRELLPEAILHGNSDLRVASCSSDPTQCQPGDLFVALGLDDEDEHASAKLAVQHGATAVVAEQLLPLSVPTCVVADARIAFGEVCHTLAGRPSDRLRMFGVTGTNGKTTVSHLLAAVLRAAGEGVAHATSLERYDGTRRTPPARTTPGAAEFASLLARAEAHGCRNAVVEASSRALAERRISGVSLDAAILTNIRRDHIDFHGSTLNYRKAKARLLEQLKPDGFVVANADDPTLQSMLPEIDRPLITFGRRNPASLSATVVERFQGEQTFLLNAGNETVPVRCRVIGDHHVSNCLAAAAAALVLDIPLTTIARGLESVESLPGRLERVECGQEFGVFVDCADTPDRLAIALRAIRQVTPGRVICLVSGNAEGAADQRPLLGRVAERSADAAVITASEGSSGVDLDTVHEVLDGYERPARAQVIPVRPNAIRWAIEAADPGDSVLIAGSSVSHDPGDNDSVPWALDAERSRECLSELQTESQVATLAAF